MGLTPLILSGLNFFGTPTEAVDMKAWRAVKGSVSNPIMPYIESEKADPM